MLPDKRLSESFVYSLNPVISGHGHIQSSTLKTKIKNPPAPLKIAGWGIFYLAMKSNL